MNSSFGSVKKRILDNMNRMDEDCFDENIGFDEYCNQVLDGISEKEIFEALDSRGQRLSASWQTATTVLQEVESLIIADIQKNLKPNRQNTPEEFANLKRLGGCKVFIRNILVSINNTLENLKSGNIELIGMAIVASGAVQEQLDECIRGIKAQKVTVDILELELTSLLIKKEVNDIPDYQLKDN